VEILSLATESFRNLDPARIELHPRLNVLLGGNGQGKTNLLEAIALVSGRPSFRASEPRDAVRSGAPRAAVAARLSTGETLGLSLEAGARAHTSDGRRVTRLTASRRLPAVFLTSEDLTRLSGPPSARRRALDRAAFMLEPRFAAGLAAYERARAAKTRLLSSGRAGDPDELAVWEDALVASGARVAAGRRRAVAALEGALAAAAERLGSPYSPLSLALASDLPSDGDEASLARALRALVVSHRAAEMRAARALVGPHRDDVVLRAGGAPVATRASSGENRTLVLAWTLAELALLAGSAGTGPVFAFDDFDSEWDRAVVATFARALPGNAQVFLTSARREAVEEIPLPDGRTFEVARGAFRAERSRFARASAAPGGADAYEVAS
jgi:DNA replication and repair protein RecF